MSEPPEELRDREADSTTFKQCGWCKWAFGMHRHDYCIVGRCVLHRPYHTIRWDTECVIAKMSFQHLVNLFASHRHTVREHEDAIILEQGYMEVLSQKIQEAASEAE